jgi:hypothetical protein
MNTLNDTNQLAIRPMLQVVFGLAIIFRIMFHTLWYAGLVEEPSGVEPHLAASPIDDDVPARIETYARVSCMVFGLLVVLLYSPRISTGSPVWLAGGLNIGLLVVDPLTDLAGTINPLTHVR